MGYRYLDLSTEAERELHDFFADVSLHISDQMAHMAEEETLSYLLCALMNPSNKLSGVLSKSASELQKSLWKGRTPMRFEIKLQLHSKSQENKVSGSDIGLIFNLPSPEGDLIRTAVLLQAKRLRPKNNLWGSESLYPTKSHQHAILLNLAADYQKDCCVQYLLYNPYLSCFTDPTEVAHRELTYCNLPAAPHCHSNLDKNKSRIPTFAGLRVIPASLFSSEEIKKLSLKDCYSKTIGYQRSFPTFADFLIDQLKGGEGSSDPSFIEIADGKATIAGFKSKATLNFTIGHD